jgi:hypothetical protein
MVANECQFITASNSHTHDPDSQSAHHTWSTPNFQPEKTLAQFFWKLAGVAEER